MIKQICKGAVIGIANIIPGVSGGTMAVSMGIYDKLIFAITHLFKDFKNSIKILVPIILGAGIGIVGLSFIIEFLFAHFPIQTNLLFIGLIIGGLPMILNKVKGAKLSAGNIIAFLLLFSFVIVFALIGEKDGNTRELSFNIINVMVLFGIGIIASATMVIPGVSGSMILMLLGFYNPIIESINAFIKALAAFDMNGIMTGFGILAPFGAGAVIGIFAIAKLIEFVFEKYPILAYFAIIGLIMASPVAIILMADLSTLSVVSVITGIAAFAVGYVIAAKLAGES